MSAVELHHLAKSYGRKQILRDVNLSVEAGEFTVVFGLPASGKSVLVRLLTGLETPDQGSVLLRGADVTRLSAGERNIGYVPQSFALYPHFTVRQNIAYPLDLAHVAKAEIEPEVQRVAALLGIQELLDRKPDQLSGGQKQRVAIARGLVKRTDIYVLDDPLVGLDFKLRERLIDDLKRTQEMLKVTFIYTTSDAVESLMLASQIAVLDGGEIIESGAPETLYANPQRTQTMHHVAFPQANLVGGLLRQQSGVQIIETSAFRTGFMREQPGQPGGEVQIGIRPEHIRIGQPRGAGWLTHNAKVLLREDLGGEEIVYLDANGLVLTTVVRSDDQTQQHVEIDQTVEISVQPHNMIVFQGGRRIGVCKGAE
ncbi:MAG TPA: ABC transporter ATP-binding protein [Chloroflexi bacterium]|nr:ABC transporter ATP-binding protein [Chloroflexota bacterium]